MTNTIGTSATQMNVTEALPPYCMNADTVLDYCSACLNDIDSRLQQAMAQQTTSNNLAKNWGDLENAMQNYAAGGIDSKGAAENPAGYTTTANQLINMYQNAGGDKALMMKIDSMFQAITGLPAQPGIAAYASATPLALPSTFTPATVDPSNFDTVIMQGIKDGASQVSQGGDLAMINIQALVSQRQQAIQLTTQMLQSMQDSSMSILKNTGGQ